MHSPKDSSGLSSSSCLTRHILLARSLVACPPSLDWLLSAAHPACLSTLTSSDPLFYPPIARPVTPQPCWLRLLACVLLCMKAILPQLHTNRLLGCVRVHLCSRVPVLWMQLHVLQFTLGFCLQIGTVLFLIIRSWAGMRLAFSGAHNLHLARLPRAGLSLLVLLSLDLTPGSPLVMQILLKIGRGSILLLTYWMLSVGSRTYIASLPLLSFKSAKPKISPSSSYRLPIEDSLSDILLDLDDLISSVTSGWDPRRFPSFSHTLGCTVGNTINSKGRRFLGPMRCSVPSRNSGAWSLLIT